MIWRLAWSVALLWTLPGCSAGSPDSTVEVYIVEADDLRLLAADARFAAVRDLVLAGGPLWVLDGVPPFVTGVSLEDGSTVQFGMEGQGPGEFLNPWAIQPTVGRSGSGTQVWDIGNNRVAAFDSFGNLLGSERFGEEGRIGARADIREVSYADPFRVRRAGSEIVAGHFPRRIDRTGDMVLGILRRTDDRLEPGAEVVRFGDHMEAGASSFREWAAVPFWDVCDEMVVLWSPLSEEVVWLDLEGGIIASEQVEGTPPRLGLEDIETYLRWMARLELGPDYQQGGINYASMAKTVRDRFADRQPFATDLRCEPGGAAWLRLFDTSSDPLGRGQTWLRVSISGERRKFRFPVEFTPFLFWEQGAFGLLEVPEGYQRLASWRGTS